MQHTRDTHGTVEVEGETYDWEVRRQPQPTAGGGWEGIALSLRLQGFKREAVVQFPMPLRPNGRPIFESQRINVESVRNAVKSATAAGWDPTSRGKAVVFDVDADGN